MPPALKAAIQHPTNSPDPEHYLNLAKQAGGK
jgi:hypothetical protein